MILRITELLLSYAMGIVISDQSFAVGPMQRE
jgi:hypothetical protein